MGTTGDLDSLSFQLAFGITGMVLLTSFVVIFFIVYQRRLTQQQLETQKIEAAYQKELLNAGILAQEEERRRVAVELHDSIGGLLSATKIYVSNVNQDIDAAQFELFKQKALKTLNENISEVRTITNDLLPQSLERLGIVSATRALTVKLEELKNIKVDFGTNEECRFESDREKALFRILQELINNALKHSEASHVEIGFEFFGQQLKVYYKDDGKGFDKKSYEKKQDRKSFGLKNMESRMAFLEGKMEYHTAPNEGVVVRLQLPLVKKNV